jgi:hypothetical protein
MTLSLKIYFGNIVKCQHNNSKCERFAKDFNIQRKSEKLKCPVLKLIYTLKMIILGKKK